MHIFLSTLVVFALFSVAGAGAQTQAELDAAKLRADIAAQQQRESEARKVTAENDAATATALERARSAAQKTTAEADKAAADYAKSLLPTIPDPSKYKVAIPSVPNVGATTARMTFSETKEIALMISKSIRSALNNETTCLQKIIIADDAKTRTALSLFGSIKEILGNTTRRIVSDTTMLKQKIQQKRTGPKTAAVPPAAIPAFAASLAELGVSFATILKGQSASATASLQPLADEVIAAKVAGLLLSKDVTWLEPESILSVVPDKSDLPQPAQELSALNMAIKAARDEIQNASREANDRRATAPKQKNDKDTAGAADRKEVLDSADELEKAAKELAALTNDADKTIQSLYAADSQGATAFDAGLRGGIINGHLVNNITCSYVMSTKVLAANYDSYATDSLFRGLRAAVSSHTIVKYRLTKVNGVAISSGAFNSGTGLQSVELP